MSPKMLDSKQYRKQGVIRARCYPFKLPTRRFHGVNPQVYKLVYTVIYMYIHVHTSTYLYVPVHNSTYHYQYIPVLRDIPVYTSMYQYIPVHPGTY
jgi:hypothetical protein